MKSRDSKYSEESAPRNLEDLIIVRPNKNVFIFSMIVDWLVFLIVMGALMTFLKNSVNIQVQDMFVCFFFEFSTYTSLSHLKDKFWEPFICLRKQKNP